MNAAVRLLDAQEREFICPVGITLMEALKRHNVFMDAPCGGNGTCGKCRVFVSGALSGPDEDERRLLGNSLEQGVRLACRAQILGDCQVRLLGNENQQMGICQEGTSAPFPLNPAVRTVGVSLAAPTLKAPVTKENALRDALFQQGISLAPLSFNVLQQLSGLPDEAPLQVLLNGSTVLAISDHPEPVSPLGMAVDIGTTTVVAYFYRLSDGQRLQVLSALNPQRSFGADVISRIQACMQDRENLTRMRDTLLAQLNGMIDRFCTEQGCCREQLACASVCGNTTMLHLLCGIAPDGIAAAPFAGASLFGTWLPAQQLGLHLLPQASVYLAPSISSYVGADITAGLLSCGILEKTAPTVFLDVGTNGEMALYSDGALTACSTAAGPAFEGAHIQCGTGSVPGAVCQVTLDRDNQAILCATIDDKPPVGICGSGLIDALAVLLECGAVDETGRLCDADEIEEDWVVQYLDEDAQRFYLDRDAGVYLTAQDIREIQLAKAAIAAGISTMLQKRGLAVEQVGEICLAGGFGTHIHPESACRIGLLPPSCAQKITVAGNAAGMGAVRALLSRHAPQELEDLVRRTHYLELSGDPVFQEEYIEQMMFPEED